MSRNLKALGLALVAVLALGAMVAQGASAHEFTSDVSPTVLTGEQESGAGNQHVFTAQGQSVKCTTATFTGTVTGKVVDTVTVHPTYSGCKFGTLNAVVTTTGCNYIFGSDTTTSSDLSGEHAAVSVECNHTNKIIINVESGLCVLTIGDTHPDSSSTVNQGLHGVTYKNETEANGKGDVTVTATVRTIKYEAEGSLCFLGGIKTGTFADGSYDGTATLTGWEDKGGPSGGGDVDAYTEGAQANISVD